MDNEARVNHPSYYEKKVDDNRVHPECIDLLEIITRGIPGILALDLGQLKYCYRFGSKAEEGLSRKEKALEDVKKIEWYMKDFRRHFYDYKIEEVPYDTYFKTLTALVAEEFAFDKPESVKPMVRTFIEKAMLAKTPNCDLDGLVDAAAALAVVVERTSEEEWN